MDTLLIILIVIFVVAAVLAIGGYIAVKRRMERTEGQFRAMVEQANHDLAAAHAADNGWEPARLEAAARRAHDALHPGEEITTVSLVQVIDKPGTDEDEAVFHVERAAGTETIRLRRSGDDWQAA